MAERREKGRVYLRDRSRHDLVIACASVGTAVLLAVVSVVGMGGLSVAREGTALGAVFLFWGLVRAFTTKDEQVRFGATGLVIPRALDYLRLPRPFGGSSSPS